MRRTMVRYTVRPDAAEENEALVRAVYEELDRTAPPGLRYATLRLDDGVTFVHIAISEDGGNALVELEAFQAFQRELRDRCATAPVVTRADEVGAYRAFGG